MTCVTGNPLFSDKICLLLSATDSVLCALMLHTAILLILGKTLLLLLFVPPTSNSQLLHGRYPGADIVVINQ